MKIYFKKNKIINSIPRKFYADWIKPVFPKNRQFIYGINQQDLQLSETPKAAAALILPLTWNYYFEHRKLDDAADILKQYDVFNKPIITWVSGDYTHRLPDGNFIVLQHNLFRSTRRNNEYVYPAIIRDPLEYLKLYGISIKSKNENSSLSFCGVANNTVIDKYENILKEFLFKMQNMIFKLIDSDPRGRSMSLYGLYQQYDGQESLADLLTNKNDINQGFGYEYERIIDNSKFRFATETNLTTADWVMDADNIILERQSSIFTGSFEIYQPENDKAYQFKDLKFVFSKHRVTDLPDTSADHLISNNYWDNNNTQFTASFLNKQPNKRLLLYVNIGNVFRVPSVDESISNQTYPYLIFNSNDLLPEQKSMYELGLKIENIPKEPGNRTYSLIVSGFSYSYYDKIKQLHLSGTPIKYPNNFGQASIAGIEADLSYQPTRKWISLKTCISNYILSDPLAFQLQPEQMLRSIISIKNKWFNMDLIYRSESSRHITTIEQNGVTKQSTLKPISNIDLNIYRVFTIAFVRSTISFSGKNLNSSPQELEGISIYDRRYALNINISL